MVVVADSLNATDARAGARLVSINLLRVLSCC